MLPSGIYFSSFFVFHCPQGWLCSGIFLIYILRSKTLTQRRLVDVSPDQEFDRRISFAKLPWRYCLLGLTDIPVATLPTFEFHLGCNAE